MAAVAAAVAATYRSLSSLVDALDRRGAAALTSISLDAAAIDRGSGVAGTVGQAVAQTIVRQLLATNPDVEP